MKNIEEITHQLEEGVKAVFDSDKYRNYLNVMSKFYNYSFNNCVLIAMQMPEASLVAGYKAWQTKFNRQVKKGEKAIRILAPIPHKIKKMVDGEEKEVRFTTYKATNVFDISQTEGEEIETLCKMLTRDVADYQGVMESLKAVSPVEVYFEDIEGEACGYYSFPENRIVIQQGMSQTQTIKTLIHEIAHSVLHDRETGEEKEADRRTKEVQAESVAYTVCQHLGLDTSDYSFEYVAGWSEGREVKELQASMEAIRKTSKGIIEQIAGMRKEVLAA